MRPFPRCIVRVRPVDIEINIFGARQDALVIALLQYALEGLETGSIKVEFKEGRAWPREGEPIQEYVGVHITLNPAAAAPRFTPGGEPVGEPADVAELARNMRGRVTMEVFKALRAIGFEPILDI